MPIRNKIIITGIVVIGLGFIVFGATSYFDIRNRRFASEAEFYNQAIAAFNQGDWNNAKELFSKVSSDSPYYQAAQSQMKGADEVIKKGEEERRIKEQDKLKQLQDQIKSLQNQSKQTSPSVIVNPSSNSAALIKKFSPAIVKLTCSVNQYSNETSQGSGTLFFNPEDNTYTVFTNYHVIETSDRNVPFCIVTIYPNSPSLSGALAYKSRNGSFTDFGGLDISAFSIDPIDDSVGQSLFNQSISKPLSYLRQYALDGKATLICGEPQVGERVFIFGYPSVGGDSLTVTDGIVAGVESADNIKYYKTSAKIEHGNSGGAAILENGCFLGIPTLAVRGSLESLAYILPLR